MPTDQITNFCRLKELLTTIPEGDACLEWPGHRDGDGYGKVPVNGENHSVHRVAYMLTYGPFNPALHVLHKCDNPPCFRPDHLFLGTNAENTYDSVVKGRRARGSAARKSNLTESDVIRMREMRTSGTKASELAAMFGISAGMVRNIIRRDCWTHI